MAQCPLTEKEGRKLGKNYSRTVRGGAGSEIIFMKYVGFLPRAHFNQFSDVWRQTTQKSHDSAHTEPSQ